MEQKRASYSKKSRIAIIFLLADIKSIGPQDKIAEYKSGKLALLAGCNEEQSLEQSVMGVLNRIRNTASDVRACLTP